MTHPVFFVSDSASNGAQFIFEPLQSNPFVQDT